MHPPPRWEQPHQRRTSTRLTPTTHPPHIRRTPASPPQAANQSAAQLERTNASLYNTFSYTDRLSDSEVNASCPTVGNLQSIVGSDNGVTGQLLYTMYTSSASGPAQVDEVLSKTSAYMSNTWRYMYDERKKLLLLHVLKDQRQLYGYTNISRSIPWEWDPSSGRVIAEARQSCSWTMCLPKLLMADYFCKLYTGANATLAGFPANDNQLTRAPIMWDMFMRAATRAQLQGSVLCRHCAVVGCIYTQAR